MNLLITGGAGFIGRHIVPALRQDHSLRAILSHSRSDDDEYLTCDLTEEKDLLRLRDMLKNEHIDGIIHMAASLADTVSKDRMEILDRNLNMTRGMIFLARALKPAFFVNFSSTAVYPNRDGIYSEESLLDMGNNSDCLYGLSKFNSEILFNHFLGMDMSVVHLRIAQVVGKGMRDDRLIPVFLKELKTKNTITVFGAGERVVNFVNVQVVARMLCRIVQDPRPAVFNLGSDQNHTLGEVAGILAREYGSPGARVILKSEGSRCKQAILSERIKRTYQVDAIPFDIKELGLV